MNKLIDFIRLRLSLRPKLFAFLSLFSLFLTYFVLNSSWHIPSQLIIKGSVQSPTEALVSWDSGSGFNDMESADLVLGKIVTVTEKSGVIKIRRIGKNNPASKSNDIWIKAIGGSEDSQPRPLAAYTSQAGVELTLDGFLHLKKDNAMLNVPAGKDWTAFIFVMNADSGIVEIDLDGDKRIYDFYSEKPKDKWIKRNNKIFAPGDFTAKVNLPRYDIDHLQVKVQDGLQDFRIKAVSILSQKGEIVLPVRGREVLSDISFSEIPRNTKQYFHPVHFIQQAGFAALCAYLLMCLWQFIRTLGGMKQFLIGEKRIFFWLMLSGALLCFLPWLLAYWPGHLTTDSIHIWWAASNPGYFLHEHPFINILYYRFLQQIWNHFSVVGIFQIIATSLLGSYIFYNLYKNGLPFILIMPFYIWFITSVPIGLHNITLWKDIPFALLIVFWAYYFVNLQMDKSTGYDKNLRMGFFTMFMLLLCVSLFRYNGLIYLIIIPIGLVIFQNIALKKVVVVSIAVIMIVLCGIITTSIVAKHDFVLGLTKKFILQLWNTNTFKNISSVAKQYPHIFNDQNKYTWYRDDDVVIWHNNFTKDKKYNDFIKYYDYKPKSETIRSFLDRLIMSSHKKKYSWFTWNPFYILYLFLLGIFYKWFPLMSAYGYVLLTQTFFLLIFLTVIHGAPDFDWRYHYFLYLAGIFLIPLLMLDIKRLWHKRIIQKIRTMFSRKSICQESV